MNEQDKFIGMVFAGCKILEKIGQGGMGSVYKASHETLSKTLCVKILSPELATEERNVEFFLREARSAAKMEHVNIVQIHNFGQEHGAYFIVMSYIEGQSLADIVAKKGPMSLDDASDIILEVLAGLSHAHTRAVIHRDIKPSNILLGTNGRPKIADFGLARSVSEEKQLTMAGEMVGTAYFMSPEQGLAAQVDSRADLYSTGATFFYLLTGKNPFEGKSSIEVIHKHISDPFPNIIRYRPELPLWVSKVLDKLTRKKPADRYQSADQVITEIKKLRTAEMDGTALSTERAISMPEITRKFEAPQSPGQETQPMTIEAGATIRADYQQWNPDPFKEPVQIDDSMRQRKHTAQTDTITIPADKIAGLTALHAALTGSATLLFFFSGYTVTAGQDLLTAFFLFSAAALSIWSLVLKPRLGLFSRAFFLGTAASAACAQPLLITHTGLAQSIISTLSTAGENMFKLSSLPIYALCCLPIAAKFSANSGFKTKIFGLAIFGLSLFFTNLYFKNFTVLPVKLFLTLSILAALAGWANSLTQTHWARITLTLAMFTAANIFTILAFTTPQIQALAQEEMKQEPERAARLNHEAYLKYQMDIMAPELAPNDQTLNGQQPPKKILPATADELVSRIRPGYYLELAAKIKTEAAGDGLIFLAAVIMFFMTNLSFVETLLQCTVKHAESPVKEG